MDYTVLGVSFGTHVHVTLMFVHRLLLSVYFRRTRNSSGDERTNVNFLYDDIVHAIQNTTDWCINSATDRRGYMCERRFTKFSEIMQRPLRRSRSFKITDFGTIRKFIYDFLLVISTNLPPVLHRFQVMADYWSNFR